MRKDEAPLSNYRGLSDSDYKDRFESEDFSFQREYEEVLTQHHQLTDLQVKDLLDTLRVPHNSHVQLYLNNKLIEQFLKARG